ncbi:unnamed protein product [Rotaria sp. Silwood2]|nr:unnamed protein product [Rotaria sp. Silwood2]CAF4231303.1 unnamed protein product [Rotaria sp. Silwood2]CAF4511229.1 unnamed protein product [Rotaria sp. Silwood2]
MNCSLIFISTLLLILANEADSTHWDYGKRGPDVWSEISPMCAGKNQSPINIRTNCTARRSFEPFNFTSGHSEQVKFILANNGHTITAEPDSRTILSLTGGNLNGIFHFKSFHLHWGPNYNTGSEHQV